MRNKKQLYGARKWSQYYGHEEAKRKAFEIIKGGIKEIPRSIFIEGYAGTGKTLYVQLLLKSLLCLNRKDDEVEACGECIVCKNSGIYMQDRAHSDVIWLQPGDLSGETLESQVKTALGRAAKGHTKTSNPNRDCLFVVVNECQRFSSATRVEFLYRAEFEIPYNNVCYILVTMEPEKLTLQERLAFRWRTEYIELKPFSEHQITKYLMERLDMKPASCPEMIAKASQGSLGVAISYYDSLPTDYSVDDVLAVVQSPKDMDRWKFWEMLEKKSKFADISEHTKMLESYTKRLRLIEELQEDVMRSCDLAGGPTEARLIAFNVLNQFRNSHTTSSLEMYFPMLWGHSIVVEDAVFVHQKQELTGYAI